MKEPSSITPKTQLPRIIGLVAGVAVVAGSMLGVGVFLFPSIIASQSGSVSMFFLLWILGGFYALSGAVACGELGAMIPQAGGDYVFQRKAFGSSMAFASGWVLFVAIFGGSIAGMSVALFEYQIPLLFDIDTGILIHQSVQITYSRFYAVLLILLLTLLNHFGTRLSTIFQILLTLFPIVLMIIIVSDIWNWSDAMSLCLQSDNLFKKPVFSGLVTGFLFVNFAYSGWLNIIYVAGEVKNPGKNIPRSMFISTIGIGIIYLFLCAAFILVLGFNELAALVNIDAGTAVAMKKGSEIVQVLVLLTISMAIVTSLNATILTSSRVAYAMAGDGVFWKGAAKLGGKNRTPRNALWIQALLASLFVVSGSFSTIIEMTSIAMLLTGTLTVASMFVLRFTHREANRPYRAFGYPWFPGLYLVMSLVVFIGMTALSFSKDGIQRYYPFIGMAVLVLAFIGHYLVVHNKRGKATIT